MAKLKAGTVGVNFPDSLAAEMEEAMQAEWTRIKGSDLPGGPGEEDRKILFVGIARGLLKFLTDHREEIETNEEDGDDDHRHYVNWDYE